MSTVSRSRVVQDQVTGGCFLKRVDCSSQVTNAGEMKIETTLDTVIGAE